MASRKPPPPAKSFEDGPAPSYDKDLVAKIRRRCPHVFMVCFRDKNRNVVVYEARVKDRKLLDPPVNAYWLILEPSYQDPRRQKGLHHDREELGFLDHKFAWGYEQKRLSDHEASFSFKAFPFPLTVKLTEQNTYLFAVKDQTKYLFQQMYVRASDNLHFLNMSDNVRSIVVKGMDITTKPYKAAELYLKGGPDP